MSCFLYFIGGVDKPITLADAREAGFGHAFDAPPQSSPISGRTPTGQPGMLVWSQSQLGGRPAAYHPDDQQWEPFEGRDLAWVGMYRDAPPGPLDLARTRGLAGGEVRLGDGREWLIPQLAVWCGEDGYELRLPMVARRHGGQWVSGGVAPTHRPLAALFERLYGGLSGAGSLSTTDGLDAAVELLAVNYAVSAAEISLLGLLLTDESLLRIVETAMDWPTAMAWAQKKTPAWSPPDSAG